MKDSGFSRYSVVALIALVVLALLIATIVDSNVCYYTYKDSGMNSRYSPVTGCMLEVKPNIWIPDDDYYFKQE